MRAACLALALAAAACGDKGGGVGGGETSRDDAAAARPAPDAAAPAKTRKARPEKSRRYAKALQRGRVLAQKGDYAEAIDAFREALDALPGDPRALSELGWAAFKAGDLPEAERATEASIAEGRDRRLKAASLYNRGRIAEERGETAAAIEAYRASLELRPNETVRGRLEELGVEVADALEPRPLSGPFPDLAAACKSIPFYEPGWSCGAPEVPGPTELDPRDPYLAVRVVGENPGGHPEGESWDSCRLAIRIEAGWYVGEPVPCERYEWARSEVAGLAYGPPAAGAPVVVWTHRYASGDRGFDRDGERYETWVEQTSVAYCGIGPSGVPSCTPRLPVRVTEKGDFRYSEVVPYELDADLGEDGELRVTSSGGAVGSDARAFLGARSLVFP